MDSKITVTKRFEFAYAHHLPEYNGKCANLHGHTGILEVEIGQFLQLGSYEGMIIDFGELKRIVEEEIIKYFDHAYLNELISRPTAENMVSWVVEKLDNVFGQALKRIRIYETPDSYAEWKRG